MAAALIGAKAALLLGPYLLVTLRDDRPDIVCPNMWDLPGGGLEGAETPRDTIIRETREEVGLDLSATRPLWARLFPSAHQAGAVTAFYVIALPREAIAQIRMGDEGQGWRLVTPEAYRALPDAVPYLRERYFLWHDGPRRMTAPWEEGLWKPGSPTTA